MEPQKISSKLPKEPRYVDIYDILMNRKEKIVEDRRLKNWSLWLKKRQEQYNRLCSGLNIEPECLVMNYEKNLNKLLDTRLIEEAEKYTYEDKYRGSIHFWKTVQPLKKDRKAKIENLVYPANTKFVNDPEILVQKGYTDTPIGIQEEIVSKPCNKKNTKSWEKSETLKLKKEKLSSKINLLEPFRPDISNLMIKGVGLFEKPKELSEVIISKPEIKIDIEEDLINIAQLTSEDRNPCIMSKAVIKIGSVLVKEQESIDDTPEDNNWFLNYTNTSAYDIHTQSVCFENLGPIAVHYRWEQIEPYKTQHLPLKYSKSNISKFFFDVRPGIILPGQQFFIDFTFRSSKQGAFKELWELIIDPVITSRPLKFHLQGIASENSTIDVGMKWETIENYIQNCVKVSFATQLISEMDYDSKILNFHTDYYNLLLDKEIFEYINDDVNYKSNIINSLKELRGKVNNDKWDLSVKSVRSDIINLEKNCELRHEYLGEFNTTVSKLRKPPREEQVHNVKYDTVYSILSGFVSQIPKTADFLQKTYKIKPLPSIKPLSPKFELSGSWENLRNIKLIQESSSDEEFLKDFKKDITKSRGAKRQSLNKRQSTSRRASAKRPSTKRQSTKRQSTKRQSTKRQSTKRQSTKRQSTKRQSTKRQSTKRQSTARRSSAKGGRRQSAKGGGRRQSAKGDPGGRKSIKSGAAEKKGAKDLAASRAHRPPAVKPTNIKLTIEKPEQIKHPEWNPEPDRDIYKNLLESHVKDYLGNAIDQISSALDSLNAVEIEKIDPMHVAFPDEGLKQAVVPRAPDLQQKQDDLPQSKTPNVDNKQTDKIIKS